MFRNNLKIAFRSLLRFKGYSVINLLGLSLGLMCGTIILLYVIDELSFDQFHENKERIYRVITSYGATAQQSSGIETNGWPVGKILEREYPEVEAVLYNRNASLDIIHDGKRFKQNNFFSTPELFQIFSFPLTEGNPKTALTDPFTVVISEEMAQKYFPGEQALNQTLVMADTLNFKITGVMKNIPANSHIQADMFLSFATYQKLEPGFSFDDGWGNFNVRNYLLLKPHVDFNKFAAKAGNIYEEKVGALMKKYGVVASVAFEPLTKIYLHSKTGNGMGPMGSIDRVYLLSGIALFVILLACINFINLSTARSVYRAKEVGLRKVVGSSRLSLVLQFLCESSVLTLLALGLSLILTGLLLPFFNHLLAKNYDLHSLWSVKLILGMVAMTIAVSFLAGYYPAVIISSLQLTQVLKGQVQAGRHGVNLRRALVVFQFMISAGLVSGTLVIIRQLDFMQKQNLGFDKDQVIVLKIASAHSQDHTRFETFKEQIGSLADITEATYANGLPGMPGWSGQIAYPQGKGAEASVEVEYLAVDENYTSTLGLQIIAGRTFSKDHPADLGDGLILNETAAKQFGWKSAEEAIGKKVDSPSGQPAGTVIGVVKDYHQHGLQRSIEPIAMDYEPNYASFCAIKYKAANTQKLLSELENLWQISFPGFDFQYSFLDDTFERQYQSEKHLAQVFGLFALLTILIALIGLLGLVSFMVNTRLKEIGIRKVLGASVLSIIQLLSKEFVGLVVVANLLAVPVIWYFAGQWLHQFAYRTPISLWLLLVTFLVAIILTVLTVSLQSVKAAMTNPANSLKSE
ncbi:MAG: ABC transporter permease [Bacteroidetes bacterium]|nr:ABC transporter permease [Bacteroidota bacterium]MBS1541341.1 ABC transporter permease [Bacteroidota bacterium]